MLHINEIKNEIVEIVSRENLAGRDIKDGEVILVDPFFVRYMGDNSKDRFPIVYGYNRFGLCKISQCDCQSEDANFIFPTKEIIKNIKYFDSYITLDEIKDYVYGFSRDEQNVYNSDIDIDKLFDKVKELDEKLKRSEEEYEKTAPSKLKELCCEIMSGEKEISSVKGEIKDLCCCIFITKDGKPNDEAIMEFIKQVNGVDIYAGEYDSFGWLTGVFELGEHRVIFG